VATVTGLLVDVDGVLTVSWDPLPGIPEAFTALRAGDVPMLLVTNTTTRTRAEVATRLNNAGIEVAPGDILTAPTATAAYLRRYHPDARCLLLNEGDLAADLEGVYVAERPPIDVVVLGGAGPAFTYEQVNRAFRALLDGAVLVAMHRNLSWRTNDGMLLDGGAYLIGLEQAAGIAATVVGKPSQDFFAAALDGLGLRADLVAMIGDDVHSDVLAAQALGMTGVLVRTGKFDERVLEGLGARPDVVLESFAAVPGWLA
jgi:HAD superfamily hydrolase (TIGR01458 family)